MAHRRNALLCPFPAARMKWIGCDINVAASAVLIREPCAIALGKRSFQLDDALHWSDCVLLAKQECNGFLGCEATAEKTDGNFIHSDTSCESDSCGSWQHKKPGDAGLLQMRDGLFRHRLIENLFVLLLIRLDPLRAVEFEEGVDNNRVPLAALVLGVANRSPHLDVRALF